MYFRTVEISDPRFEHEGIRHMTVKSPALQRRGDLSLCVHPEVKTGGCECVLILLNGVYNSHWGWLYHAGVHRTARRLIDSGAMRPMLLAMPSDGLRGDGSAYIAHGQEDAERWIMRDVIEACSLAVPGLHPSARVFLAGLSMGGYGALRLGAKWATIVSGISAHSAITDIAEMRLFAEETFSSYLQDDVSREELDPLFWMRRNRALLPAIRMDCGLDDLLLDGNRRFHQSLVEAGVEHTYEEFPGGHEWPYWELHVEKTLLFCEQQMRRLNTPGK
jgi:enterochelin esterase-like enzyme